MTRVICKHGTEVYKFQCPECADDARRLAAHASLEKSERRLESMTDTKLYCLHGTLLTFDCPDCQRERFSDLETRLALSENRVKELEAEVKDHAEWAKRVLDDPNEPGYKQVSDKIGKLEAENALLRAKLTDRDAELQEAVGLLRKFSGVYDVGRFLLRQSSPVTTENDKGGM